jgi:hypothetical protein
MVWRIRPIANILLATALVALQAVNVLAIGPANMSLTPEMEEETRQASASLLEAIASLSKLLANIERREDYRKNAEECISQMFNSADRLRSVVKKDRSILAETPFEIGEGRRETLQIWFRSEDFKGDVKFEGSGIEVLDAYLIYLENTASQIKDYSLGREKLSNSEVEELVFLAGERIGSLLKVGSIISFGYRQKE